jgi:hypothetical protein
MPTSRSNFRDPLLTICLPFLVAAAAACSGQYTPPGDQPPSGELALLPCPTDTTRTVTETIGPQGGVIFIPEGPIDQRAAPSPAQTIRRDAGVQGGEGYRVVVPPNAVRAQTRFTMTVPRSRYAEVRIQVDGEESADFERPLTLVISYARCRGEATEQPLRIVRVAPDSDEIVDAGICSVDDKSQSAVWATLPQISRWVIAT